MISPEGAPSRDDEAALENHLIAFLPLVRRWARRLCGGDEAFREDLIQEGLVGILKGIQSFTPQRGHLAPFLEACVRNRMLSARRRFLRAPRPLPLPDREGLWAPLPSETNPWEEDLERLRLALTEKERIALGAYLKGGGVAEAVRLLRWPRKEVDNALQRVRRKARKGAPHRDLGTPKP